MQYMNFIDWVNYSRYEYEAVKKKIQIFIYYGCGDMMSTNFSSAWNRHGKDEDEDESMHGNACIFFACINDSCEEYQAAKKRIKFLSTIIAEI